MRKQHRLSGELYWPTIRRRWKCCAERMPEVQRQAVAKCKGNPRYLRMALEEIYRCRRAKSLCDWFHDDVQLLVGDFAKVGSRIADQKRGLGAS